MRHVLFHEHRKVHARYFPNINAVSRGWKNIISSSQSRYEIAI